MRGEILEGKKEVKGGGTSQTVSIRPRGEGQDVCGRRGFNCGNLLLLIFSVSIFNILHPLTASLCLPLRWSNLQLLQLRPHLLTYMQKTCDVAEEAILAKKKLRKKCVNRDKM